MSNKCQRGVNFFTLSPHASNSRLLALSIAQEVFQKPTEVVDCFLLNKIGLVPIASRDLLLGIMLDFIS